MRALAAAGAASLLALSGAPQALGLPIKSSLFRVGVGLPVLQKQGAHATTLFARRTTRPAAPAGVNRPAGVTALTLTNRRETDGVGRIAAAASNDRRAASPLPAAF